MRFYVCFYNKWNPYSDDIMQIPEMYWVLAFNFIQVNNRHEWKNTVLPHAELIGQLTHPDIYKEYDKIKKRREKIDTLQEGEDFYVENADGVEGGGSTTCRYDPIKGLVNADGEVVIPKEQYDNMLGLDGIAISL